MISTKPNHYLLLKQNRKLHWNRICLEPGDHLKKLQCCTYIHSCVLKVLSAVFNCLCSLALQKKSDIDVCSLITQIKEVDTYRNKKGHCRTGAPLITKDATFDAPNAVASKRMSSGFTAFAVGISHIHYLMATKLCQANRIKPENLKLSIPC